MIKLGYEKYREWKWSMELRFILSLEENILFQDINDHYQELVIKNFLILEKLTIEKLSSL